MIPRVCELLVRTTNHKQTTNNFEQTQANRNQTINAMNRLFIWNELEYSFISVLLVMKRKNYEFSMECVLFMFRRQCNEMTSMVEISFCELFTHIVLIQYRRRFMNNDAFHIGMVEHTMISFFDNNRKSIYWYSYE